jgi:hypothetical protein
VKINLTFQFSVFDYTAPIVVQKNILVKNEMMTVNLFENDQPIAHLDFVSLPDFHNYSLSEWKFILEDFFTNRELSFENINLDLPFFNTTQSMQTEEGELLFLKESVIFALIEKKFSHVLANIHKEPIKVNALYSKALPPTDSPACMKIKIRPTANSLEETLNVMSQFSSTRFRLDGNRSFELHEFKNFILHLQLEMSDLEKKIEYIEEPLKSHNEFLLYQIHQSFPIALDESVHSYQHALEDFPANAYAVLKPTLLGISKSFEILHSLKEHCVLSSAYETATVIRPLLYLAALNPSTHHGFDTLKFLPKEYSIPTENFCLPF